ncbi:hypothetical protein [[Kitasatospora] papulosa]
MTITPASVLGARKVVPTEGQLDLFGPEDEPDTTTKEQTDSTNIPERTEK